MDINLKTLISKLNDTTRAAASRAACSGPAPPKATMVYSRGSWPRCTLMTRMALAMLAATISRMPFAVSRTPMPSLSASVWIAARDSS